MNDLEERLQLAMECGEKTLAYYVYWGLKQGLNTFGDLQSINADWVEIKRMEQVNELSIHKTKLYSASSRDGFHLVLALNEQDAEICIREFTKMHNVKVLENPSGMYNLLFFPVTNERMYIDEIAEQCDSLPYYIGCYNKADDAIHRGDKAKYDRKMKVLREEAELVDKLSDMFADGLIQGSAAEMAMESVRKGRID